MKILVTGGAGFIGSHLVDKLLENGHEVVVVDDLSGGTTKNLMNQKLHAFYDFDCRNAGAIDNLFEFHKPEVVYHLAANAAENKAQFSPIDITSRNYDAFIKVLTPFIKYGGKRFVFTSSIAVYGSLQIPFKETDRPEPEDLYGISKLAAEQTLKVMSKVHGFEYVITRPHNVYGERQNMSDPYRNVVTIWMNRILTNMPYFIYGDGEQKRCFSYIDDVIEAIYKCGFENVSGQIFNIGSDKAYSLNQLSYIINQFRPIVIPQYLPKRVQEVENAIADHSNAKKYLGYEDKISLEEGLRRTWEWCQKVGDKQPKYDILEIINDKVPKNWKNENKL